MIANRTLIGRKCGNTIAAYAELADVPLREALDIFYKSNLYYEIRNGISDMHCRSDNYLAEELRLELKRGGGAIGIRGSTTPPSSAPTNTARPCFG